jgi:hypothetical protein
VHHLGGIQDFEADNPSIIAEVGNHTGTHLVAFLDALLPGISLTSLRNMPYSIYRESGFRASHRLASMVMMELCKN